MMRLSPKPLVWACVVILTLSSEGTGFAQTSTPTDATILGEPSSEPRTIQISIGKAQLYRLPVRVADVIVADPNIADVNVRSPELIYLLGRAIGVTNIMLLDADQNVIYALDILVSQNFNDLRGAFKTLYPDDDINIASVRGNIILTGTVRSARVAEDARNLAQRFVDDPANVINRIRIQAEQQVMMRVRISEVRRTIAKELGISGVIGESHAVAAIGGGLVAPLVAGGITGPLGTNQFRIGLPQGSPFRNAALAIDVLEREGLVRTLAEPTLTSLSGEGASFLAGGEIPVPSGLDQNGNLVIDFRDFGVSLGFTPTVLDSGRINMHIAAEVSEIDNTNAVTVAGLTVPGFTTRRTQTTVEMPSGGSLVIGGLLQSDFDNLVSGIPGLMDIPVIGALFRSIDFQRDETELVVTVTAYIVRPIDDREIVLPTDGFAPASDADMYLLGKLHARYGREGSARPEGRIYGPVGFVME